MYQINNKGAVLNLYRIINPLADPTKLNKYPILYGHGVLYDAKNMISRSENAKPRKPVLGRPTIVEKDDQSLPFMFSNNNFDVWMFDARAVNDYNRNLSADIDLVKANKIWDFSLDDEALIDLPVLIDSVLAKTGSTKVVYTGYSESTFFMLALMSRRPEYQEKVAAFVAMAPVAYVSHIKGLTIPIFGGVGVMVPDSINYNFLPQSVLDSIDISLRNACGTQRLSNLICAPLINSIAGKGSGEMSPEFFASFFKSTSSKVVKHFLQLYLSKRFCMYDYGHVRNLAIYGQPTSPDYHLANIKSDRIILAYGLKDFLSTPMDHARLVAELGHKPYRDIAVPDYNHFDWIDGKDLVRKVNGPVMLAVFELMYKDGPDILKSPAQIAAAQGSVTPLIPLVTALGGTEKVNRANMFATPLIDRLTGGGGLLGEIKIAMG